VHIRNPLILSYLFWIVEVGIRNFINNGSQIIFLRIRLVKLVIDHNPALHSLSIVKFL